MTGNALARLSLATAGATFAFSAVAHGQMATALLDHSHLAPLDLGSGMVGDPVEIAGVDGMVLGIDIRPANGMLYTVDDGGVIYTIDPESGMAEAGPTVAEALPAGEKAIVDFNPAADRLRLMFTDGTNYRVNVETGETAVDGSLAFNADDMHAGEEPGVVAGAYTNSFAGTEATQLYDIDATLSALLLQNPPNDGGLQAVGLLGPTVGETVAFDIMSDGNGGNTAYLVTAGGSHTVDLESGEATMLAEIHGTDHAVTDFAVHHGM